MSEMRVIKSEPNKHFTVFELCKIFGQPGVIDYRIVATGFSSTRIKIVELIIDPDLFLFAENSENGKGIQAYEYKLQDGPDLVNGYKRVIAHTE